jgi:LysM repeat protein
MKSWLNIVLAAVFVITGVLVWVGVRDRRTVPMTASAADGVQTVVLPTLKIEVGTIPAQQETLAPASGGPAKIAPAAPPGSGLAASKPAPDARPAIPVAARDTSPAGTKYVAQPGDTISKLAVDFFGSDSKTNEDAILSSNPSLQQNPDRILAGQTYLIPTRFPEASDAAVSSSQLARIIHGWLAPPAELVCWRGRTTSEEFLAECARTAPLPPW